LATTLDFSTSSIDTMTLTLVDDATFAGASTAMTSVTATKIASFTGALAAGSDALFSLVSDVTAGTITVATGATLDMDFIGATSGGDSSVTISGRGGWASSAALELRGDDVTLNFSALTGGNAVQITAANITGKATISAGTAAASITGGAGNDTLTGGAGADSINGGDGNDTITISSGLDIIDVGAGANTVNLVNAAATTLTRASSSSAIADSTALTVTGVDTIASFTTGDTLSFSGLSSTIVAGTAQTIADGKITYVRGAATNANTFTTDAAGSDVLVVWDTDTTTSGTFKAVVLIGYGSLVASDAISYTGIVGVA
jgi:Ca2+-binding RTX toxin-like protein